MWFFIPTKPVCPVCKEPIDLYKAAHVGPKGSEHEGKAIHGLCQLQVLQELRNKELREVTACGK